MAAAIAFPAAILGLELRWDDSWERASWVRRFVLLLSEDDEAERFLVVPCLRVVCLLSELGRRDRPEDLSVSLSSVSCSSVSWFSASCSVMMGCPLSSVLPYYSQSRR